MKDVIAAAVEHRDQAHAHWWQCRRELNQARKEWFRKAQTASMTQEYYSRVVNDVRALGSQKQYAQEAWSAADALSHGARRKYEDLHRLERDLKLLWDESKSEVQRLRFAEKQGVDPVLSSGVL